MSFTGFSPDREGPTCAPTSAGAGLADRVAHVRRERAERRDEPPELNVLLQTLTITEDREYFAQHDGAATATSRSSTC